MIQLYINKDAMELKLHGSDERILSELSTAVMRMLCAMEQCNGYPVSDNLTVLILKLLEKKEQL